MSEVMEENGVVVENKMGTEPVHGLFIKMSIPLIASNLVMALYNIVDSIFVSRINENALTAVSLVFPVQQLLMAFGMGTAVGMSALMSRYLGAKNYEKVNKMAQQGIFLAFVNYAIFFIVGCFSEAFMRTQTDDAQIIEYGATYMKIVCTLCIGVFMQVTVERLLQSTGKTSYIFVTQATGAVINMIMDPILIFGLFGAPEMGIAGAAAATVFGQIVGCVLGIIINIKKNTEVSISFKGFRPNLSVIREIYIIGLPSIIMQSVGSVLVLAMNKIVIVYTTTAVAAFGVYFKLQSFVFMPIFGMSNGLVPIIAYNYGAGKKDRLMEAGRIGVYYGIGLMVIGFVIFETCPALLLSLFDASEELTAIGVVMLRTIAIGFPFAGFSIMRGAMFQALGKSTYSMISAILRQLVVLIPLALIISLTTHNLDLIWIAFPVAEMVAVVITLIFYRKIKRELLDLL